MVIAQPTKTQKQRHSETLGPGLVVVCCSLFVVCLLVVVVSWCFCCLTVFVAGPPNNQNKRSQGNTKNATGQQTNKNKTWEPNQMRHRKAKKGVPENQRNMFLFVSYCCCCRATNKHQDPVTGKLQKDTTQQTSTRGDGTRPKLTGTLKMWR